MAFTNGINTTRKRFGNAEVTKRECYSPLSVRECTDDGIKPWNPFSMKTVDEICMYKVHECSPLNYNISQSTLQELDNFIDLFDLEISEYDFQYEKVLCMKLQTVSSYFGFRFVIQLPGKMLICTTCKSLLKNNYRKCHCIQYDFDLHSLINLLEPDFAICVRGQLETSVLSLKCYKLIELMKVCLRDQCEVSLISHGCIEENGLTYPEIDHRRVLMPILYQSFVHIYYNVELYPNLRLYSVNSLQLMEETSTVMVGWKFCLSIWHFGNLPPPNSLGNLV